MDQIFEAEDLEWYNLERNNLRWVRLFGTAVVPFCHGFDKNPIAFTVGEDIRLAYERDFGLIAIGIHR